MRRPRYKRVHRDAKAWRDGPADVVAAVVHDIDVGCRAKVDHDGRSAVELLRSDGVGDAVCADLGGARSIHAYDVRSLRAHCHDVLRDALRHGAPFARELRHHPGEGDGIDALKSQVVNAQVAE